jgi:cation diffusion facilitator CzcD-associated flavoprotein CzcO
MLAERGLRIDIRAWHVYQYTFELNTQWSKFFSPGIEILEYVKEVAEKYDARRKVEFETRVDACIWEGGLVGRGN